MLDLFDKLGNELNDHIGSHDNNTVGYVWSQIYPQGFAEGGAVPDPEILTDSGSSQGDNTLSNTISSVGKAISKTGSVAQNILGGNYINSPTYLMQHFSNLGNFFRGAEPGNKYTDSFQKPLPTKPAEGNSASNYYAKWYENMRRFAEASEVAQRGQTTVRSR